MRMTRHGAKKRPFYHIVVADSRSPRDGRFIEKLGSYNPMLPAEHADRIRLQPERIQHWLSHGALATERVMHIGEPIAMVVAETAAAAQDAAESVTVEYEELTPVTDAREALRNGAPQLWPQAPGNLSLDWQIPASADPFGRTSPTCVVSSNTNAGCNSFDLVFTHPPSCPAFAPPVTLFRGSSLLCGL